MASHLQIIHRYVSAFAALQPDTMDDLMATVETDIHFVDPFNDVTGHDGFRAIFDHMFATCDSPKFHILDVAISQDSGETRGYLRWRMSGRLKSWPRTDLNFEGMSEIHIGPNGLIGAHFDHWDSASQLLARLPVIGAIIRPILRLFIVRTDGK